MNPALMPLATGSEVAFWICAPLMILGALGLVLSKRPVYSALSMVCVMILLACLYASLDAPFLLAIQIIVYTGAIMMMFLFVLTLIGVHVPDSKIETLKGQKPMAIILCVALLLLLVWQIGGSVTMHPMGLQEANAANGGNLQGLADQLFGRYVFVFELASALLITAAMGAMVLAHRVRVRPRIGQRAMSEKRMQAYAKDGVHPGTLPNSGVYAHSNSIAMPALLPDGSIAESSVSPTLAIRGTSVDPTDVAQATRERFAEIEAVHESEEDE